MSLPPVLLSASEGLLWHRIRRIRSSLPIGSSRGGDGAGHLNPNELALHGLVDLRFRGEEAINIRRRHMQLARNISDGRLLKSDLTEQAFRDLDNQLVSVSLVSLSVRII